MSLNSVKLGNSLISIGEAVFFQCRALTSITIPKSVTSIGRMAFWQCEKIKSIKLGENITTIGESAFNGVKINKCYCYATTPPIIPQNGSVFLQDLDATLYVPARCGTKYKASYWGSYFKYIKEMDE